MARDYVAPNRRPRRPVRTMLPGWVWMVAGLSMGLVIAVFVYIGRPTEPMPMTRQAESSKPLPPRPRIEIPPKEDPRFDFYTLLESEQVVVTPGGGKASADANKPLLPPPAPAEAPGTVAGTVAETPATPVPAVTVAPPAPVPAAAAAGPERYIVVLGAFRDASNAEQHKAQLALSGIEADIEHITGQDRTVWHRVRIGPRNSLASAQAVLAQVKQKGFDGRVVRMP